MSFSLDPIFKDNLTGALGQQVLDRYMQALEKEPATVSVRRNPIKLSQEAFAGHFAGLSDGQVPWCRDGIYLRERPQFHLDPLVHAGAFYVQDAASMVLQDLFASLRGDSAVRVLDLCAAPGGKSTCIASQALSAEDILVSNEVIRSRSAILAENMAKWGRTNIVVTNDESRRFASLEGYFDIVLADVPCSGEGMFRKDAGSIGQWSPDNVALCSARQRKIVAEAWPSLKTGGILIYSTCTFNRAENDGNVEWICRELGAEAMSLEVAPDALRTDFGLQFIPGSTRSEGLYLAALRKTSAARPTRLRLPKLPSKANCDYARDCECYRVSTAAGDMIKAYPCGLAAEIMALESSLGSIRSGVAVASVKGRDLVPTAAIALSECLCEKTFPCENLSAGDALKYLRLDPLVLNDAPRGFILLQYEGIPLGFVKNLGSRTNNLFPSAWRLRSTEVIE
ncbi:MAG: rRNA cytosine-C5-methyltransferase [Bacteroidales bacterium]|nr:rRNA cytosine-C5-methyltransferase [Bacteroidales bacterium]